MEALRQARADQDTQTWKERYKTRAGVEGTITQAAQRCGLRRSRCRGLAKTSLQHQLTGAAINLARLDAHSPTHAGPAPAPATSQHFAPPSQCSTGRSRPPNQPTASHRGRRRGLPVRGAARPSLGAGPGARA